MGNGLVKPVEHPRWEGSSVGIEFGAAPEERSESRLGVETHEGCLEEHRYLNMDLRAEHTGELLRQLEEARELVP